LRHALTALPLEEDVVGVDEPQRRPGLAERTEEVVEHRPAERAVPADDPVVLAAGTVGPPGQRHGGSRLAAAGRTGPAVPLLPAVRLRKPLVRVGDPGQGPAHQAEPTFLVGRLDSLAQGGVQRLLAGIDQYTVVAGHGASPLGAGTTKRARRCCFPVRR